jgi:hypothetical protein
MRLARQRNDAGRFAALRHPGARRPLLHKEKCRKFAMAFRRAAAYDPSPDATAPGETAIVFRRAIV